MWPAGASEMAARIRPLDWASTPLGPIDCWPISLRSTVDLTLGSPVATILLWGAAHVQIYNDLWRDLIGDKHPVALGHGWQRRQGDAQGTVRCAPALVHGADARNGAA